MTKPHLVAAGAMAALALQAAPGLTSSAAAQTGANQPNNPAAGGPGAAPWSHVPPESLPRAIRQIERQTGGKVLEIRYRTGPNGGPRYDAVVSEGRMIAEVTIGLHPQDQAITIDDRQLPTWMVGWQLRADQRSLRHAKVPLARAVAEADRMTGGRAIDARLARPLSATNTILAYNIEVMKGGLPTRVAIDAENGAPIANPDSLFTPWTPERDMRRALNAAG